MTVKEYDISSNCCGAGLGESLSEDQHAQCLDCGEWAAKSIGCPICECSMTIEEVRYDGKDETIWRDEWVCENCRHTKQLTN